MNTIWRNAFAHATGEFNFMVIVYALLAAVVVLFVMRKTGLMRREAKWHRTLVCVYYLYIPIVFVCAATAWSTVYSAQSGFLSAVDQARPAIATASADYASSVWSSIVSRFRKEPTISLRELGREVAREYSAKLLEGFSDTSRFTLFMKPLVSGLQEGVALSLGAYIEEKLVDTLAGATKVDKELLQRIWKSDLVVLLQGGIVCDILEHQVTQAFKPFYAYLRVMTILFLLPVILETAFSVYRRRKRAA
ncbi:membrane hypothetical protein [uncultured delta proteobacterium]|uniref:Uncharacterized protein n=1 Tax=uncultured delta proteobacterium TaxID=34034 RepID=A0A212JUP0_9DELT|nr:membrane hypothetical protein [uncultured delta proteobacterium]